MSNWTVHLEFEEGTSSKFWRARVEDSTLYVNYGKIGSAGQTQVKDFGTADLANKEYDKLVREKRKKGYVDAGSGGGGGGATDGDEDDVNDDREDDDEDAEDAAPRPAKRPQVVTPPSAAAGPAARPPGSIRLLLETGNRKVETWIAVVGGEVRMDSSEKYATPDAAKKAHDRLKKMLLAEGYKES
ncbi:MAG TPA: WGR domain-containing protein [Kofleriaceae bacterium]|jgi:predicted DNA-binding WGR domain protein|nr:WGR domain-containing protein [Kofleriaceae bacterium]